MQITKWGRILVHMLTAFLAIVALTMPPADIN